MNLWLKSALANPLLIVGTASAIWLILYVWLGQRKCSIKSKYFKLYVVLIDVRKAPDFAITALEGDFPEKMASGFVTYVRPRIAKTRGLEGHQIVGALINFKRGFTLGNFAGNRAFKDKIHAIAANTIPEAIRAKAAALGTGEIRLLDDRVASQPENAGDEDCIGLYIVADGVVAAYVSNPDFQLLSNQGPLELVESIRTVLRSETELAK